MHFPFDGHSLSFAGYAGKILHLDHSRAAVAAPRIQPLHDSAAVPVAVIHHLLLPEISVLVSYFSCCEICC